MIVITELRRRENENEKQYIWRLGQAKDNGASDLTWHDIANLVNQEFREDETDYRHESAYRKPYQCAKDYYESGVFGNFSEDEYLEELRALQHEAQKARQKVFDERTALRRIHREQARRETMVDIVKNVIDEYVGSSFEYVPNKIEESDNDVIIHLTDIHGGMYISSVFNEYDFDIIKRRLTNYLDEINEIRTLHKSENAYVILGGDMIHGLIHVNSRIEAKENIVSQIMYVSDLVSNFIYELSKMFKYVEVHTTAGNHSRVTANKEETTKGENFDLLIPFTCKKHLKDVLNVCFKDNVLDCEIATFSVRGHMVYASHGDKDGVKKVVQNMTKFARKANISLPDIIYLGHRHVNGLSTIDDVKVVQSGCVGGMDNYAIDNRYVGSAEQTVTVVTERKRIKALYDIQIN